MKNRFLAITGGALLLALASAGPGCGAGLDEDLGEVSQAVTTNPIETASFTAKLFQNGGYDKPLVLLEGFDPSDDYTVGDYFAPYWSDMAQATLPQLLASFPETAAQEGWDIWMVSYKKPAASGYGWTLASAYVNELHDAIRGWGGVNRKYVIAGFSMGGLVARKALINLGSRRASEILGYISIDTPHEGAYVPYSAAIYMLDHAICSTDKLGSDALPCEERFGTDGLASHAAYSLIKNYIYPTAGIAYSPYVWPSFWSDCHDTGGCTLPGDADWSAYSSVDPEHGNFVASVRSPSWFNSQYGGWFTDIPRYAISNSPYSVDPAAVWTSPYEFLKVDVDTLGDHHLYSDPTVQPQKRASGDPFMDRLNQVQVHVALWIDASLHKVANWGFVSYDSALGRNQGLSWTGVLTGQAGTPIHSDVTVDTVRYLTEVLRAAFSGTTFPGTYGPASVAGPVVTVTPSGSGSGTASSSPASLFCSWSGCSNHFYPGTRLTLYAHPDSDSTFAGWTGPCSGTGSCTFTVSSSVTVGARYNRCGDGICQSSERCETTGGGSQCEDDCGCCAGWEPTCFAPGTPVTMADGSQKSIEEVQIGDQVLSYDVESGQLEIGTIGRTFTHHDAGAELVQINGSLMATGNHPFYVDGQWRRADELQLGDQLFVLSGRERFQTSSFGVAPVPVSALELMSPVPTVYNLEVNGAHDYFAGGVLVHNKTSVAGCSQSGGGGGSCDKSCLLNGGECSSTGQCIY